MSGPMRNFRILAPLEMSAFGVNDASGKVTPKGADRHRLELRVSASALFRRQVRRQGDVIDLWAALTQRELRAAAMDLVHVFGLEPSPQSGTEEEERFKERLASGSLTHRLMHAD